MAAMRDSVKLARDSLRQLKGTIASGGRPRGRTARRAALALLAAAALAVGLPPWTVPVAGTVSSGYWFRWAPDKLLPTPEFHDGLDYAAPVGTRVTAAAWGRVAATGEDAVSGRWVRVAHPFGFSTFYAHLSRVEVKSGDLLPLPFLRPIGRVGTTGRSTGPHLHFEIKFGKASLPPQTLLVFHHLRRWLFGF
jgi:murein DD-endopeptidase MepM/ murein hydrolase activator NlpD